MSIQLRERGDDVVETKFWPILLRQSLPVVGISLKRKDTDVLLDLAYIFDRVYQDAAYDLSIAYDKPPEPPLQADDAKWAAKLLREVGLRKCGGVSRFKSPRCVSSHLALF